MGSEVVEDGNRARSDLRDQNSQDICRERSTIYYR